MYDDFPQSTKVTPICNCSFGQSRGRRSTTAHKNLWSSAGRKGKKAIFFDMVRLLFSHRVMASDDRENGGPHSTGVLGSLSAPFAPLLLE